MHFILGINTDKITEGGVIGLNFGDEDIKKYSQYNFINRRFATKL